MLSYGCHDAYTETLAWLIYIRLLGIYEIFFEAALYARWYVNPNSSCLLLNLFQNPLPRAAIR